MSATDTDQYPFGYKDEELERLGDQHQVWQEENEEFLDRAGFKDGDILVDLGCGPGFTTVDLARRAGPKGRVIAVDRSGERSIPRVYRLAEAAGLGNVETRAADLEQFDLPAESVDGVYSRWVLMYLREDKVGSLVTRIAKWLKPGAACALAEFCNYRHITVHPRIENFDLVAEALMQAAAGPNGSNPEIGNVLPGLMDKADFQVELDVVVKAIRPSTPEWQWPDKLFRQVLPMLVDKNQMTQEIMSSFLYEWDERSRNPSTIFFSSPVLEVVGRRV